MPDTYETLFNKYLLNEYLGRTKLKCLSRATGELFFFQRNRWLTFLLKIQWVWEGVSGTTSHKIVYKVNEDICEGNSDHVGEKLQNAAKAASSLRWSSSPQWQTPNVKETQKAGFVRPQEYHLPLRGGMAVLLEDITGQRNMATWQEWKSRPGICGLLKRTSPTELVSVFCPKEILYLFVFLQFCLLKFPETFSHLLSSTKKTVPATQTNWFAMLWTEEGVWQLLSWEMGWIMGMVGS